MKRIFALLLALLVLAGCSAAAVDWQEQYDLGIRYLSEQNYSEAILAFTAAIEVDPNRQELYIGRAQAYIASGETEENLAAALADYEKAKELGYTDADLWLGMADIYIRQGDYDKALEILQEGSNILIENTLLLDKIEEVQELLSNQKSDLEQGNDTSEISVSSDPPYLSEGVWYSYAHHDVFLTEYHFLGDGKGYTENKSIPSGGTPEQAHSEFTYEVSADGKTITITPNNGESTNTIVLTYFADTEFGSVLAGPVTYDVLPDGSEVPGQFKIWHYPIPPATETLLDEYRSKRGLPLFTTDQ